MSLSSTNNLTTFPRLNLRIAAPESNSSSSKAETSTSLDAIARYSDARKEVEFYSPTQTASTPSRLELTGLVEREITHVGGRNRSSDGVYVQKKEYGTESEPYADLGFLFSDGSQDSASLKE